MIHSLRAVESSLLYYRFIYVYMFYFERFLLVVFLIVLYLAIEMQIFQFKLDRTDSDWCKTKEREKNQNRSIFVAFFPKWCFQSTKKVFEWKKKIKTSCNRLIYIQIQHINSVAICFLKKRRRINCKANLFSIIWMEIAILHLVEVGFSLSSQ